MKHLIRFISFTFFAITLCVAACKCEDDKLPEDILKAPACWRITLVEEFSPTANSWVNVTNSSLQACELDNCFKFNDNNGNKILQISEGATKCSSNAPTLFTGGSWSVTTDDETNTFTIEEVGEFYTGTLIELNDNKFVWELSDIGFRMRISFTAS